MVVLPVAQEAAQAPQAGVPELVLVPVREGQLGEKRDKVNEISHAGPRYMYRVRSPLPVTVFLSRFSRIPRAY